jgi:hypothetical protein
VTEGVDELAQRWSAPPRSFGPGSLARTLVEATSRALRGNDCGDLDWLTRGARSGQPAAVEDRWRAARAAGRVAIAPDVAHNLDAAAVSRWIIGQYDRPSYPGVVIGSPHGSAAHLAAALDVPWLPTGFETDVGWPGGNPVHASAAMAHGAGLAMTILDANPDLSVRQVHDPVRLGSLSGGQVNLHLRWRSLPTAYRRFLESRVEPGGFALLLCDVRSWPVLDGGDHYTFQVGSAASGLDLKEYLGGADLRDLVWRAGLTAAWRPPPGRFRDARGEFAVEHGIEAGLREWAHDTGGHTYSVLYGGPDMLTAAVADVYRDWLRAAGRSGDRLLVESGRLLDPWQVLRIGAVPYWCEAAIMPAVAAAALWLAGSDPFARVEVFPEPPGRTWSRMATLDQWSVLTRFASQRGNLNRTVARAYPLFRIAPRQVAEVLRGYPADSPPPAALELEAAIGGLRAQAALTGLLISFGANERGTATG